MASQEEIRAQEKLLATSRQNLAHLLQQAASYGGASYLPLHTSNNLHEVRSQIAYIKAVLRDWGVEVEDHPSDPSVENDSLHSQPNLRHQLPHNSFRNPLNHKSNIDYLSAFICSVVGGSGVESLQAERAAAEHAINEHPLSRAWVWEYARAERRPPREVFLQAVRDSDLFLLILGKDITSAVREEYEEAVKIPQKPILVFVKVDNDVQRPEERMSNSARVFFDLLKKSHTLRSFVTADELKTEIVEAVDKVITDTFREFRRTPVSRKRGEGVDATVLLMGAGELGMEIARSLRRYSGNRVILAGIDRYNTPPARDELHSLTVIPLPWQKEQILETVSQMKPRPDKIIPELMATPPGLFRALSEAKYSTLPDAKTIEMLIHRPTFRRELDSFLQSRKGVGQELSDLIVRFPEWRPISSEVELERAFADFGQDVFLKPAVTDLGLGQSRITAPHEISDAWLARERARYKGEQEAIVEQPIDFTAELYQVVVRANGEEQVLQPIEYRRVVTPRDKIGGPWQLDFSVQPPVLTGRTARERRDILRRSQRAAVLLFRHFIDTDGFFGFEFLVRGSELWLNKVTFRPDINGIVTVYSSRPSIFDVYAKLVLGYPLFNNKIVTPAACCPVVWPDVEDVGANNRFYIRNIDAIYAPNVEVFPIDKHEFNPRDRVAFVVAWSNSSASALSLAQQQRDKAKLARDQIHP
jgi:phosphoribosylglycinamide formyltransferase 2